MVILIYSLQCNYKNNPNSNKLSEKSRYNDKDIGIYKQKFWYECKMQTKNN